MSQLKQTSDTTVLPPEATADTSDGLPWWGVRLFNSQLKGVLTLLKENQLQLFVPMQYVDYEDHQGKRHHELKPVVRNLVFVKKTVTERRMRQLTQEDPLLKMAVIKKSADSNRFYEIPASQMRDFVIMCNPEIELRKYISEEEAKLKAGTKVNVLFGPLKGVSGRLVRSSKKYYLLKEVPGMAVMIKVSRWCCRAVSEE